jgi:hypothetical protein
MVRLAAVRWRLTYEVKCWRRVVKGSNYGGPCGSVGPAIEESMRVWSL